jgi:hypothetical protein
MSDWRKLRVEGLGPISRQVSVFQVGPPLARLPFASFKIKVIERPDGSFLGVPNVACRSGDGSPDWISGLGSSAEEALEDTLRRFVISVSAREGVTDADFEWAAPEDF